MADEKKVAKVVKPKKDEAKPAEAKGAPKKVVPKPKPEAKEAKPKVKPVPKPKEAKEPLAKIVDEAEEKAEKEAYKPRQKPKLDKKTKRAMSIRRSRNQNRPAFKRQEWHRYQRLGEAWRKPRGKHSKARRHVGYRVNVVRVGYRGPRDARGLHPSGYTEVLVHNVRELTTLKIDPATQAVRIGHGVGSRKRDQIMQKAAEKGIRVLNREA